MVVVLILLSGPLAPLALSPANAVGRVEVTVNASRTSMTYGERVVLRGRAWNAPSGARARLERQSGGIWTRVASQRLNDERRYRFTLTPPAGSLSYRVKATSARGRTLDVSRVVFLAVERADSGASITFTTESVTLEDGSNWLDITGQVHGGPATGVVDVQSTDRDPSTPTSWTTQQSKEVAGDTPFTVRVSRDQGVDYRLLLENSDNYAETVSSTITASNPAYILPLNSTLALHLLRGGTDATAAVVAIPASGEDAITIAFLDDPGSGFTATVVSPSGLEVGKIEHPYGCECSPRMYLGFTANENGKYLVRIQYPGSIYQLRLSASTIKAVPLTVDGPDIDTDSDFAHQPVDITFHAEAGQAFRLEDGCGSCVPAFFTGPDGLQVRPWIQPGQLLENPMTLYRAEQTGTYRIYYEDGRPFGAPDLNVVAVTFQPGTVDGEPTTVAFDRPGRVRIVTADLEPGDTAYRVDGDDPLNYSLIDASTQLRDWHGTPGPHYFVLTGQPGTTATLDLNSRQLLDAQVDGAAVTFDGSAYRFREVDTQFTGTAGQVVELPATGLGDESLIDPDGHHVADIGLLNTHRPYQLPVDGTYTLRAYETYGQSGSVSVKSVPVTEIPGDGTSTTLTVSEPGGVALGHVAASEGSTLSATLEQVDPQLGDRWWVVTLVPTLSGTSARDIWNPQAPPDTRSPFVVNRQGGVFFAAGAEDQSTGSVRVSAQVTPP